MNENIATIWVYLAQTPLLWLAATLAVYQVAGWIYRTSGQLALLNPVLVAIIALVVILRSTDTTYTTYFDGAQFVHFLLGPATVALAIPLYLHAEKLRQILIPLLITLLIGACSAILFTAAIGAALGLDPTNLRSMLPRSVTTPIAMGISQQIGGLPSLTAVLVILTGIVGALTAPTLLNWMNVRDQSVQGFAIGLTSHGIGTARAFQLSAEAGAFSGLAMGLNGAATTLLMPLLMPLVQQMLHW
ncbi:MAG: LrgB family protein [Roseiflexaceae bacterium]